MAWGEEGSELARVPSDQHEVLEDGFQSSIQAQILIEQECDRVVRRVVDIVAKDGGQHGVWLCIRVENLT
jgi:hypothetical protein